MSDLSSIEKRRLEHALDMGSGYVLKFSNRTFSEFFFDECGIDIYDTKYDYGSGSKANRMRAFWEKESNYLVAKVLSTLFENWSDFRAYDSPEKPSEECFAIVSRLRSSAPVPEISAVVPNADDRSFESLARSVQKSIEHNEPEAGLDRLHTFVVKYFRVLCEKRGIDVDRKKPLHSLVGEYVKALKREGKVESEMTERILKSSISIMESFNKVRNDQSYAHDNEVLGYNEALLIFAHVTSSIRFLEAIEATAKEAADEIPF